MRCPRCGNENPEQNRFCGMCGTTLLSAPDPPPAEPPRIAASESATLPLAEVAASRTTDAPRAAAPVSDDTPSISGPSFLGLNDPPPRKRASLSIDPHNAPSSSNLDYLLDDEEEPRHWGGGKILLILIALALAVGLGYLRWRNHGFAWLNPAANKPSAVAQNSTATDGTPPANSVVTPDSRPPATVQPAAGTTQPPADSTSPAANPQANPAPAVTTSNPALTSTATTDTPKPNDGANPAPNPDQPTAVAKSPAPVTKQPPVDANAAVPDETGNLKPTATVPAQKPRAASKPVPVDPVTEAQKYLYGRDGAAQDCDRGMRLLKPAANQANPKAMIEMGALYSAGLCTPHDLPTAYRWFALALRKDPDNLAVQTDLQKLWGEMTQPERQLAIKLSQ